MIPSIIYGTAWKKDRTASLVTSALTAGFRAIDTANQPKHYNEPGVGEALKEYFRTNARESVFVQSKFTPLDGQDHRVPYDPSAAVEKQVEQSLIRSLEHLHVNYLDSFLLHGPYHFPHLGKEDRDVWQKMEQLKQKELVRNIGISNVSAGQLTELLAFAKVKPVFVQNRCFAVRGWDAAVRQICAEHAIIYQGFSLLTANHQTVYSPVVKAIARRRSHTPEQVIFAFSRGIGIVPLTGTSDESHMRQDLTAVDSQLDRSELDPILQSD